MDNIEITVFDEITDYKEKIYFFNFRQWLFTILIGAIVIPTYLILKDKIGDEITSYIVIAIAGILGFIGFVKIHELPAEKILPYWFRHYFLFAKPIEYMTDEQFEEQKQQKKKMREKKKQMDAKPTKSIIMKKEIEQSMQSNDNSKNKDIKIENLENQNSTKDEEKTKENEKTSQKEYTNDEIKHEITQEKTVDQPTEKNTIDETELAKQLSNLTDEQKEALLKLLGR